MILLVVLIPSVMAAPLLQQNTVTAEGALTGTVQAAETETEAQPKTLLGKVKKSRKKSGAKDTERHRQDERGGGHCPHGGGKAGHGQRGRGAGRRTGGKRQPLHRQPGQYRQHKLSGERRHKHRQRAQHHRHHSPVHKRHHQARQHHHNDHHTTCNAAGNTALPKPEYNKYEYTLDGDYAKVSKYTGNAKVVVLPAAIDGHQVKYYCTGTFTNKDIELAVFEDFEVYHTLWVQNAVFKDCKS